MDSDILAEAGCGIPHSTASTETLDRIEVAPSGELYISCKAVGSHANAFRLDWLTGDVSYAPTGNDELAARVPQVVYVG
jgi:hypothetical protein